MFWLSYMLLQMFIGDKLIEAVPLSINKISDTRDRDWYIQGAVNELLEKWQVEIKKQDLKPQFFIKI